MLVNNKKNRNRDAYSFANINLLGKCNVDCYFCLGKDIESLLSKHNQLKTHFSEWRNFGQFINICKERNIENLYITGQNTDSLLYNHLADLINFLQIGSDFHVGLRTNGYLAEKNFETLNLCEANVGYSVHSLDPLTNKMMIGNSNIPDWDKIIPATKNCRVSIVLNRCNQFEFFSLLKYLSKFENIKYIQVRRVSTDTRLELLAPDIAAYEETYSTVQQIFQMTRKFVTDAEEYNIYGKPVVFWRTVKTSVNSLNYFTDGTISDNYFIVEGYLNNYLK